MKDTKEKKRPSKWMLILLFAVMLSTAYYLGVVEGKVNGKIELCEDIGGFYGVDIQKDTKTCFNATILDNQEFDFIPTEIDMEVTP